MSESAAGDSTETSRASDSSRDIFGFIDELLPDLDSQYGDEAVWELYRGCSTPELYAFLQILEQDYKHYDEQLNNWQQDLEELHDPAGIAAGLPEAQRDRLIAESERIYADIWLRAQISIRRLTSIYGIIRDRINHPGTDTPPLNELDSFNRRGDQETASIPPNVFLYASEASEVMSRLPKAQQSVDTVCSEIAQKLGMTKATPYKWLCSQNPFYKANEKASQDVRYRELETAIGKVLALRKAP